MKKLFKILWKSILFSVCVVVLIVGVLFVCEWHRDRNQYCMESLSENIELRWYYNKNKGVVYNRAECKNVEKGIDRVVSPADGDSLTVFFRKGLRGYLNVNTGIPEWLRPIPVWTMSIAIDKVRVSDNS